MAAAADCPGTDTAFPETRGSSATAGGSGDPGAAAGDKPVCLIVLGMAGSGKTTFVQVSPGPLAANAASRMS